MDPSSPGCGPGPASGTLRTFEARGPDGLSRGVRDVLGDVGAPGQRGKRVLPVAALRELALRLPRRLSKGRHVLESSPGSLPSNAAGLARKTCTGPELNPDSDTADPTVPEPVYVIAVPTRLWRTLSERHGGSPGPVLPRRPLCGRATGGTRAAHGGRAADCVRLRGNDVRPRPLWRGRQRSEDGPNGVSTSTWLVARATRAPRQFTLRLRLQLTGFPLNGVGLVAPSTGATRTRGPFFQISRGGTPRESTSMARHGPVHTRRQPERHGCGLWSGPPADPDRDTVRGTSSSDVGACGAGGASGDAAGESRGLCCRWEFATPKSPCRGTTPPG